MLVCVTLFFFLVGISVEQEECIYKTVNGQIDLRTMGNTNGLPKFSNIPDINSTDRVTYSYNGCFPINQEGCTNAAICKKDLSSGVLTVIGVQQQKDLPVLPGVGVTGFLYSGGNNVTVQLFLICNDKEAQKAQGW
ncbi:unnamed protein product [Didymodactylos carnosus]|uniref:Uncharacterized protein n=1 Tax=Didymodactylos carnosus TaxID=1234261 RepID=A0A8S2EAC8_9BILA|nr:unnamed protein product [Didymodactylos carnosus]CAF3917860.1 unnamed protein product [Didymodactylos carnosus]